MKRTVTVAAIVLLAACIAGAGEASFTEKPAATRDGVGAQVTFAVSGPTDVEAAVLDAKGQVVRHLAAGLLGPNAPAPLARNSLKQSLTWDGKDDAGAAAQGAPFSVRVRLGLRAEFDKVIGWSGQQIDIVDGVACGPDGTLYVVHSGTLYAHRHTWLISAFDRDGRYLRCVFPGPANLPPEKRKGWPRIKLDDGTETPVVFHLLTRSTYPGAVLAARVFPVVTKDGRLVMLSGPEGGGTIIKSPDMRGGRRLLILGTDGSVPENWLGPEVAPAAWGGIGHVALSPDEKCAYVAGLFEGGKTGKGLCHVVWRVAMDGSGKAEVFAGKMFESGAGKDGLNDPQGLAVDKDGNVYIADYGNNRIAVFGADGRFADEIPVEYPDGVMVSARTGAVYAATLEPRKRSISDEHYYTPGHNWKLKKIVKFGGLKDKTVKAEFAQKSASQYGGGVFPALDDSGDAPVLWLGGAEFAWERGAKVLKIADRGGRLESLGTPISDAIKAMKVAPAGFFGDVTVAGDKVLIDQPAYGYHTGTSKAYSAATGEPLGTWLPKDAAGKAENMWKLLYGEMHAGRDGNLYVTTSNGHLRRYAPDGSPLPFASTGQWFLEGFFYGHTHPAGLFTNEKGETWIPTAPGDRKLDDVQIKRVGADGKVLNESVVRVQDARLGGIAVARDGSVYLGAQVVQKDERIPARFAGKLPPDGPAHHPGNDYKQHGMLLKFPPEGGAILADANGKYAAYLGYQRKMASVKGALWERRLGLIPNHGDEVGCFCETTRFDLDPYGRLFMPDPFRFCVVVLDGEGNELTRFGSYGNMDSRGPGSPVPEPGIAFGWPISAACSGDRAFVADVVNRRAVAVKMGCAAEATCEVR